MDIWKADIYGVAISVKFFGVYFGMWSEWRELGETNSEFIDRVKKTYRSKYPNRKIKMRIIYPMPTYDIQ